MCFFILCFGLFVVNGGRVCHKKIIEVECIHLVQANEGCVIIYYVS